MEKYTTLTATNPVNQTENKRTSSLYAMVVIGTLFFVFGFNIVDGSAFTYEGGAAQSYERITAAFPVTQRR